MAGSNRIRSSVIAGKWYPGDPESLKVQLRDYLAKAEVRPLSGELTGIIVPHAGYLYSGGVAAHAYSYLIDLAFKTVIIISPLHRLPAGSVVIPDADYFETPLGLVKINTDWVSRLAGLVRVQRVARDFEHSLEIQLPFLQYTLGDQFDLVPLMMGDQSLTAAQELSRALIEIMGDSPPLVVASTDLSHFYDFDTAQKLDARFQDYIENYDPNGLARAVACGLCEACGAGPTITAMFVCEYLGADRASILKYANSGSMTGDLSSVVGYVAAALYKSVT